MWEYTHYDELYHYGVPGMKWGVRKARGHGGLGRYLTKKRRLAGDKKDIELLNKGSRLSVGLTKKRQESYDARDRASLEKRIAKNTEVKTTVKKAAKIGAAVTATALAAYGGYKVNELLNSASYTINGKSVSRKEFTSTVRSVIRSLK